MKICGGAKRDPRIERLDFGANFLKHTCIRLHYVSQVSFISKVHERRGQEAGEASAALNVSLSESCLLIKKFSSENTTFGAQNPPFWGNLRAKLKF